MSLQLFSEPCLVRVIYNIQYIINDITISLEFEFPYVFQSADSIIGFHQAWNRPFCSPGKHTSDSHCRPWGKGLPVRDCRYLDWWAMARGWQIQPFLYSCEGRFYLSGRKNSLLMGAASGQLGVDDISIELKNASAFMCLNLSSDDNVMISQIRLTAS